MEKTFIFGFIIYPKLGEKGVVTVQESVFNREEKTAHCVTMGELFGKEYKQYEGVVKFTYIEDAYAYAKSFQQDVLESYKLF